MRTDSIQIYSLLNGSYPIYYNSFTYNTIGICLQVIFGVKCQLQIFVNHFCGHVWLVFFQTAVQSSHVIVKKYPSGMSCWDSNSLPLGHQSPPIATRPGLPPIPFVSYLFVLAIQNFFQELQWDYFERAEEEEGFRQIAQRFVFYCSASFLFIRTLDEYSQWPFVHSTIWRAFN